MRAILELNNNEAKDYFLKSKSYCNFDLPEYFNFDKLLSDCNKKLRDSNYGALCLDGAQPKDYDNVNYKIFTNKDGEFAWRKFELIHPILYVALVNLITDEENWRQLIDRFSEFKCEKIKCCSMILIPDNNNKENAVAINNWSENFNKQTLSLSLEYSYIAVLDITDCYGSMYTHGISWAIIGKEKAKKNKQKGKKIELDKIDGTIEAMSYGQTNGIPQGSSLMDFIAELMLGYIDMEISGKIKDIQDIKILRYRDDYRIFSNNIDELKKAMKIITETLSDFNFRINSSKTFVSSDIVIDSQKKDKLEWKSIENIIINERLDLLNRLIQLKKFANINKNSGSLKTALTKLYENKISKMKKIPNDYEAIIAIIVEIMFENPCVYMHCVSILSKIFDLMDDKKEVLRFIKKITKKFSLIPNTAYLDLWLQRLTIKIDAKYIFQSDICKLAYEESIELWNSDWLKEDKRPDSYDIFDEKLVSSMNYAIPADVVALFSKNSESPL